VLSPQVAFAGVAMAPGDGAAAHGPARQALRTRPAIALDVPAGVVLLALICAFSFGYIWKAATADPYHTTCVGHGIVQGASTTDGSFFSRIEAGCSAVYRYCGVGVSPSGIVGAQDAYGNTSTCNAAARDYGSFTECHGYADVYNQGIFSEHNHLAVNWCG
jgi:hypothetical protein